LTTPYLFERPIAELILRPIFLTRFRITVVVSFRYSIIGTQSYRNTLSRGISTVITLRDCHLQLTIAYHRGTCVCRDSGPWLRGGPQSSDTTQKAPGGCYIESLLRGCIGRHRGCAYVEIANLLPLLNIAGYTRGGASRSTVDTSSICANGSPTVATPKTHTFGCRWWTLVIVAAIEVPSGRDRVDKYGPVERSSKFWTSRLSCGRQPALQHNSEGQIDPGIGLSTAGEPLSDPQPTHRGRCQHPNASLPAPHVRSTANTSSTTPCQSEWSNPQPTHRCRCQHPNAPLPAPRVRSTANTSLTTPCQSE